MANKVIKVLFEADPTSFARVKQQLESLAGVAKRAMEAGGGVLTGSVGSSNNRNGQVTVRGSGSGSSPQMQKVGISQAVSQNIASQAAMFKGLAQDATKALADMNTAVANSVRHQTTNLNKLIGVVKELGGAFGALPAGMGGYASGGGGGGSGSGGGGSGSGGGGGSGSSGSPGNGMSGGADYGERKDGAVRSQGYGLMGLIAGTAAGVASIGSMATANKDLPYLQRSIEAQWGGNAGGRALSMGRMTGEGFTYSIAQDLDQKAYMQERKDRLAALQNAKEQKVAAWNKPANDAKIEAMARDYARTERGSSTEESNRTVSALLTSGFSADQSMKKLAMQSKEAQLQAAADYRTAHPEIFAPMQEYVDNVANYTNASRALGVGDRYKRKDGTVGNRIKERAGKNLAQGYTFADNIAALQSIVPSGGFGTGSSNYWLAQAGTTSHMSDSGAIIGGAAQLGQNPALAMKHIAGMGTKGKLDWQAKNDIGKFLGNMAQEGAGSMDFGAMSQFFSGGLGDTSNMSAGQQMAATQGMVAGYQDLSANTFGGNKDPLQKGLNMANALNAFGSNTAAHYITDNPDVLQMMIRAKKEGVIPDELKDFGINSMSQIMEYVGNSFADRGRLGGAITAKEQTPVGDLLKKMQAGGYDKNYGKYALENVGRTEKERSEFLRVATSAEMLDQGTKNRKNALGIIRDQIGFYDPSAENLGGLADSRGKISKQIQEAQGKRAKEETEALTPQLTPEALNDPKIKAKALHDASLKVNQEASEFAGIMAGMVTPTKRLSENFTEINKILGIIIQNHGDKKARGR